LCLKRCGPWWAQRSRAHAQKKFENNCAASAWTSVFRKTGAFSKNGDPIDAPIARESTLKFFRVTN
jgi:hypothetical protein